MQDHEHRLRTDPTYSRRWQLGQHTLWRRGIYFWAPSVEEAQRELGHLGTIQVNMDDRNACHLVLTPHEYEEYRTAVRRIRELAKEQGPVAQFRKEDHHNAGDQYIGGDKSLI